MLSGSSGGSDEQKPGGWRKGFGLLLERMRTGEKKEDQRARRYGEKIRKKTAARHEEEGGPRRQTLPGEETLEDIQYKRELRRIEAAGRMAQNVPPVAHPLPSSMSSASLPLATADSVQLQFAPTSRVPSKRDVMRMGELLKQQQAGGYRREAEERERQENPPMDTTPPEMGFM